MLFVALLLILMQDAAQIDLCSCSFNNVVLNFLDDNVLDAAVAAVAVSVAAPAPDAATAALRLEGVASFTALNPLSTPHYPLPSSLPDAPFLFSVSTNFKRFIVRVFGVKLRHRSIPARLEQADFNWKRPDRGANAPENLSTVWSL